MSSIPKHFQASLSTLKETSYDKDNNEYMTQSEAKVIDFDKIKDWYAETVGGCNRKLSIKSNDVLSYKGGHFTFIEFKNGDLSRTAPRNEIKQKIYDSFVILCDPITEANKVVSNFRGNVSYFRDNVDYILVYNEIKNSSSQNNKELIRQQVNEKAKNPRFGLAYFKGYLFRNVYTYTKREFETRFVSSL